MTYKQVKDWRIRTKYRIVESMGGKCVCCGYNKCNDSLTLHHIKPKEKGFKISSWEVKNWNKIVDELRKCILVCRNCHGEIHAGIRKVPKNAKKFNEDYATYDHPAKKLREIRNCDYCGNEYEVIFNSSRKYCSSKCSNMNRYKVDWSNIDWSLNNNQIAQQNNISWTAVKKQRSKLSRW